MNDKNWLMSNPFEKGDLSFHTYFMKLNQMLMRIVNKEMYSFIHNNIVDTYKILKNKNYNSENKYNYKDNYAWIENIYNNLESIILKTQSNSWIVILKEFDEYCHEIFIYQIFENIETDVDNIEDDINKKQFNYKDIVKMYSPFFEYSDNIDNKEYIYRPNLEYFKSNNVFDKSHECFNKLFKIKSYKDNMRDYDYPKNENVFFIMGKLLQFCETNENILECLKYNTEGFIKNEYNPKIYEDKYELIMKDILGKLLEKHRINNVFDDDFFKED